MLVDGQQLLVGALDGLPFTSIILFISRNQSAKKKFTQTRVKNKGNCTKTCNLSYSLTAPQLHYTATSTRLVPPHHAQTRDL